jgi:GNAT superfamily N-acetyltransferase
VTTNYRIRKCEPEAVKDIADQLLVDEDSESVWTLDGEYWAVVDQAGTQVGFAGLRASRRWTDCVYFHCAGVSETARGHHLQRRLIRARLRWAAGAGYLYAHTYTLLTNPASSKSLVACGFRPYWPTWPWAGRVCYWYRRLGGRAA